MADACKAPYEFESLHWDSAAGSVVAGPCVDKSALSSIEQEQQAYLVEGTIQIERVDERGADLSGAQMSNEDLTDANFSGADMENANLDGAKLFMADLTDTNLRGASLQNSILEFAKLGGANLTNANLTGADLDGARLRGTIFCNTIMPDGVVNNDGCS